MFRQIINQNPFLSQEANYCFGNITADSFDGDYSLVSTLRALVAPRMEDGDEIQAYFEYHSYSKSFVGSRSVDSIVKELRSPGDEEYFCSKGGFIYIHDLNGTQVDNYAVLEAVKSGFTDVYNGWVQLERVTAFYRKEFYVLCFVNTEAKCVEIFVDNLDVRKLHYLQCSIVAFLPWYFDAQKGISEEEMELIQSLKEKKSSERYLNALNKIAEQYDFRSIKIKRMLDGFETRFERRECDRLTADIESKDRQIRQYNDAIADLLQTKNDLNIRLMGLQAKIASGSGESEVMDFFLRSRNLDVTSVSNTALNFVIKDYLEFFDEDLAERVINNKDSVVYFPNYRDLSGRVSFEDMKLLMTAIFIDQTLRIKVCAAYKLVLGKEVVGTSGYDFMYGYEEYMPNPHIQIHGCLGNYRPKINEFILRSDYIGAVSQCVASCKSLNFGDSVVMGEFMESLYGTRTSLNNKCIELPNGSTVTPKEAIAWLKKQEEESDE